MKPQHFYDELTYQLTLSQAKLLLTQGVIDEVVFLCFMDRIIIQLLASMRGL